MTVDYSDRHKDVDGIEPICRVGQVALTINSRPRKTLGWKIPAEALDQHLRSL